MHIFCINHVVVMKCSNPFPKKLCDMTYDCINFPNGLVLSDLQWIGCTPDILTCHSRENTIVLYNNDSSFPFSVTCACDRKPLWTVGGSPQTGMPQSLKQLRILRYDISFWCATSPFDLSGFPLVDSRGNRVGDCPLVSPCCCTSALLDTLW